MLIELANRIKLWVNSKLLDKQDTLVSGTNIKTINSVSLLGSGNIETSHGDVAGPISSVNNNIVAFDGTTGKQIKDSGVLYTDVLTNDLIGTDVQAYNTNLANISALSFSTGDILIDLGDGLDRLPIGADGDMLRVAGGILAYEAPNFAPLFTNDATLTEATTSYSITDKNVRITISSGTTGSLNTIIDMATTNLVGEHFVVIDNNSGGTWTLTTTSLNNFVDGSYPINDGTEVAFIIRRNLLTTTFDETTHIFVGNVGQTGVVALTTTNIAEGTNLYYTSARFDTDFATKDTDDLSEGTTNLYNKNYITQELVAGENLVIGDVCRLNVASGKMVKANNTSFANASGLIAICIENTSADQNGEFVLSGVYVFSGYSHSTGTQIFIGGTSGTVTGTEPNTTGNQVRSLGYCLNSVTKEYLINIDNTIWEVS